jgi:hypothetical protein
MLRHTVFYRKWAFETEKYLYDDDLMDKNPEWSEIISINSAGITSSKHRKYKV